jgi:hypothetical protein
MLMHFFRGTGIHGLRGMLPKQGDVVRPLLFARKQELAAFAAENKLHWVEDSSNAMDKYSRNYFRNQLIPLVQNIYPETENNLAANLRRFAEMEQLYEQAIAECRKSLELSPLISTPHLILGGVLERFPRLRALFLEAGAAWGPYLFERLDEHWEKRPQEMPLITRAPSEYLADGRIVVSCEGEQHLPHALAGLGEHSIVYASDYPHWDAEFPDTVRHIADRDDLTDEQKTAVLGGNAARLYGWETA